MASDLEFRVAKLYDLQNQMLELLDEAESAVTGTSEWDRARTYWIAAIKTALVKDHEYLSKSYSMEDTIKALEEEAHGN